MSQCLVHGHSSQFEVHPVLFNFLLFNENFCLKIFIVEIVKVKSTSFDSDSAYQTDKNDNACWPWLVMVKCSDSDDPWYPDISHNRTLWCILGEQSKISWIGVSNQWVEQVHWSTYLWLELFFYFPWQTTFTVVFSPILPSFALHWSLIKLL